MGNPNPNPPLNQQLHYTPPPKSFEFGFGYDLNQIEAFPSNGYNTDPVVTSGEEHSGSGSEGAYSSTGLMGCYQNSENGGGFAQTRVKEEVPMQQVKVSKDLIVIEEEENGVQKLSEELMAFENYMKFYQIPYLDGQSAGPNAVQESDVGQLWSFDDDDAPSSETSPSV